MCAPSRLRNSSSSSKITANDVSILVTFRQEISQIGLTLSNHRGQFENVCASVDDFQDVMQDFNALGPVLLHQLAGGTETPSSEQNAPDDACFNDDTDISDRDVAEAMTVRLVIVSQKFRTKFGNFLHNVWYPMFGVSHRLQRAIHELVRQLDLQIQATDTVEVANELTLEIRHLECLNEQFVASSVEFEQALLTISFLQQQVKSLRQMEEKLQDAICEASNTTGENPVQSQITTCKDD